MRKVSESWAAIDEWLGRVPASASACHAPATRAGDFATYLDVVATAMTQGGDFEGTVPHLTASPGE